MSKAAEFLFVPEPTEAWLREAMAPQLRPDDLKELSCYGGESPADELVRCWRDAQHRAAVVTTDLEPIFVFGVRPIADGLRPGGLIWLLATNYADKRPRLFCDLVEGIVAEMLRAYCTLGNLVSVDCARTIRWLEYMHFTVRRDMLVRVGDGDFHPFVIKAPEVQLCAGISRSTPQMH